MVACRISKVKPVERLPEGKKANSDKVSGNFS